MNFDQKADNFMQGNQMQGNQMQGNHENRVRFTTEIRIIPALVWVIAAVIFAAAQIFFNITIARHASPPPAWCRPLLGLLAGVGGAIWVLFLGYVNRDAKRRGMSPTLWTLVAMFIPNALGILLYFILRHPLHSACPQCGCAVQPGFNFCPRCSYKLSPNCPQCGRGVSVNDVYCPYCGTALRTSAPPVGGQAAI